jgi:TolA-binding protein
MNDWPELDALVEELRNAQAERWNRIQELRQQLQGLQPHLEVLRRQFEDLQIDAHLRALNDQMLAGLGSVELVSAGTGIEYLAALVWPAHVHPHAAEEEADEGVLYRIEVWLGPSLQDGRPRIRIAGERRLEAVLPTSGERFRAALLRVFREPQRVERPAEQPDAEAADESSDEQPQTEGPVDSGVPVSEEAVPGDREPSPAEPEKTDERSSNG